MTCIESQGPWPGKSKDSGLGISLAFAQPEGLTVQSMDELGDWIVSSPLQNPGVSSESARQGAD